jgi:ankyrin repeat protein
VTGNRTFIQLCIDAGADMTRSLYDDKAPLHLAASHGHTEIVSLIASHLPSYCVTCTDKLGKTPLDYAREHGFTTIVTLLEPFHKLAHATDIPKHP